MKQRTNVRNPSVSRFARISLMGGIMFAATMASARDVQTEAAIPKQGGNLYGIGVAMIPETSGASDMKTMVLPIIQANFGDRYYINALRGGVWLADSADKRLRFGLAADVRFGWDAADGVRTRGMQNRDTSFDVGPTLRWQTDLGTFNASWAVDAGGASNGQTAQVQFVRALIRGPGLRLNGLVGATWNDQKMNNYYFGVAPAEVRAGRPAYQAGSGVQTQLGINGFYPLGPKNALLFGAMITRLSDAQANSPIVETRNQPLVYGGYAISF